MEGRKMRRYVYRCPEGHEQEEQHGMRDDPVIVCNVCGKQMRRKPQAFRFYFNPTDVLLDKMDGEYRKWRGKKNGIRKNNQR